MQFQVCYSIILDVRPRDSQTIPFRPVATTDNTRQDVFIGKDVSRARSAARTLSETRLKLFCTSNDPLRKTYVSVETMEEPFAVAEEMSSAVNAYVASAIDSSNTNVASA